MEPEARHRLKTLVFGALSTALGAATALAAAMLALRVQEAGGLDLLANPRFALTAWIFPAYAAAMLAIGWSLLRRRRLAKAHLLVVGALVAGTALVLLLAGDTGRALLHFALGAIVVWQLRDFVPR